MEVIFPDHLERPDLGTEQEIVSAIARLWSRDFAVYTAACRQLVDSGETALPYLGYFGDVRKELLPGHSVSVTRVVLAPILARLSPDRVGVALASPYAPVRIAAAQAVAERGLVEHAPRLQRMLSDPQEATRSASIAALRALYNSYLDYRADDPPARRERAAAEWDRFLRARAEEAASDR
ncbi:MAG: HEAT repeat domain-containing protein [Planctomycetaceae bacterium]